MLVGAGPHAPQCAGHKRICVSVHGGTTVPSQSGESSTPKQWGRVGAAVGAALGATVGGEVGLAVGRDVGDDVGAEGD